MKFNVRYEVLCEDQDALRSYEPPNRHLWTIQKKTLKGKKMRIYEAELNRKEFDKFIQYCGLVALFAVKDNVATHNKPVSRIAFANVCTNRVVAMVDVGPTMRTYSKVTEDQVGRIVKLVNAAMRVYGGNR